MRSVRAGRSRPAALLRPAVPLRCIFFSFLLLVLCEVSATDGFFSGSELLNKAPVNFCEDGWRATRHGCEYTWRAGRSGLGWRDSLWLLLERLGLHHRVSKWRLLAIALVVIAMLVMLVVQSSGGKSLLARSWGVLPFWKQPCLPDKAAADSEAGMLSHGYSEELQPEVSSGSLSARSQDGKQQQQQQQQQQLHASSGSAKKASKAARMKRKQREAAAQPASRQEEQAAQLPSGHADSPSQQNDSTAKPVVTDRGSLHADHSQQPDLHVSIPQAEQMDVTEKGARSPGAVQLAGKDWVTVEGSKAKAAAGQGYMERKSVPAPVTPRSASPTRPSHHSKAEQQQHQQLPAAAPEALVQADSRVPAPAKKAGGFFQRSAGKASSAVGKPQGRQVAPPSPTTTVSSSAHASMGGPSASTSASSSTCSDFGSALRQEQGFASAEPKKSPAVLVVSRKAIKAAQHAGSSGAASGGARKDGKGSESWRPATGFFSRSKGKQLATGSKVSTPLVDAPPAAPAAPAAPEPAWPVVTPSRPYAQVAREAAGGFKSQDRSPSAPPAADSFTAASPAAPAHLPAAAVAQADAGCWHPSGSPPGAKGGNSSRLTELQAPQSLFSNSALDPVLTPGSCPSSPGLRWSQGSDRPALPFLGDSLTSLAGVSTHRRRSAPPEEWTVGCNGQVSPKPLHGNTPEPRGFYGGPTSIWSTTSAHAPIEGSWSPSIAAEWGRQPVGMSSDGSGLPTSDRHDSW